MNTRQRFQTTAVVGVLGLALSGAVPAWADEADHSSATAAMAAAMSPPTAAMPAASSSMGHDAMHEALTPALPGTTLKITATPDPVRGVNLHLSTTNFRFAPRSVDRHATLGEGHAHLFVDGEKVGRAYSDWVHLMVAPGAHTITVVLSANDHTTLAAGGKAIEATAKVVVPKAASMMHHDGVPAPANMTFSMNAVPGKGGANLYLKVSGFEFAPEQANKPHAHGVGHAHISVDGVARGRIYSAASFVPLSPGPHLIEVSPTTNGHDPYLDADGAPISVSEVVWVR